MKLIKPFPQQLQTSIDQIRWFGTLFIAILGFASCRQSNTPEVKVIPVKHQVAADHQKTVMSQPQVITITAVNQPKVVKAGQPTIKSDPSNGAGSPYFTSYGNDQGLLVGAVLGSSRDRAGNLWFGTVGGGMSRYDGKTFTNYTIAQGLAGNVVFCVYEDKAGNIWAGTTSGISKYDGYRMHNYGVKQGLPGTFVSCILQDRTGMMWFGMKDGGVSKFDGKSFTNYNNKNGLADNYINCILQDDKGALWFGTNSGGVDKYQNGHFTNYNISGGLSGNSVYCAIQDKAGDIWMGTNNGVSCFSGGHFTNYTTAQGLIDNRVSCIVQDKTGNFWFGTKTSGISRYDWRKFISYNKLEGLPDNNITSMLQDKAGNLWLTSLGGLCKYEGNCLTHFTEEGGVPGNLINALLKDKAGNLWMAPYDGGVVKYDGKRFANYTIAQGLDDNTVWGLMQDKAGNIWFSTDKGGSCKYDGINFTNYTTAQGLLSNSVQETLADHAGNIWFGTLKGLSKFDGKSMTRYTTAQGLPGNSITTISEDNAGNIWVGTHDDGVSKFDGKKFTNYTTANGLVGSTVYSIIQDKYGNVWFGTKSGASKFDGKRFINYTMANGLPDNYVWSIVNDKKNDMIWLCTNLGLCGLSTRMPDNDHFEIFNRNTGYRIEEINAKALFADEGGIVWAGGGRNKLIRFDHSLITQQHAEPSPLRIRGIKLNNENILWSSLICDESNIDSLIQLNEMVTSFGKVLSKGAIDSMRQKYKGIKFKAMARFYPVPVDPVFPYNDNNISIDFTVIEPVMQKRVKYQYKLDGYNDEWSSVSNSSEAVFGNLKTGKYTFRFKALNPMGVWSIAAYTFEILPPWWLTWWAYSLYTVLIGGLLYTVFKLRINSMEQQQAKQINIMVATQEDERKRISRDLHDDVGIKLSALKLFLSSLYDNAQDGNDIRQLAKGSEDLIGEVMQDVRALLHNLSPMILDDFGYTAAVEGLVNKINETNQLRFDLMVFGMDTRLKKAYELALYRITQELINNILKHAQATEVSLQIGRRDGKIILMIEDNGKGFDISSHKDGYGLHNLEARTKLMKGKMSIDSTPGRGTSISIEIPYPINHE